MSTNQGFVMRGPNDASIVSVPKPSNPGPNEVLLRTLSVGICGSDIHYWHTGRCANFIVKEPMILGHETAAVVEAVGSKVKHLKPGDRVATEPTIPCTQCKFCRNDKYHLCPEVTCHATPPVDGTLVNYFLHPAAYTFKVPDSISDEEAAQLEPLSVAVHSCRRAKVTVGSRVLITGAGPIGIYMLMSARAYGASRVVMTDINQGRLNMAKQLGADEVLLVTKDVSEEKMVERIRAAFHGESPDISFECSGAGPCTRLVMLATESGGVAVQVGLGPSEVLLPIAESASREVTILGAFRYKNCFPTAIALAASGKLQLSKLVTHRFDFKDCTKAFETAMSGVGMKVMIKISE